VKLGVYCTLNDTTLRMGNVYRDGIGVVVNAETLRLGKHNVF